MCLRNTKKSPKKKAMCLKNENIKKPMLGLLFQSKETEKQASEFLNISGLSD
jgi:hypothetical protein